MKLPLPANEKERLAALRSFDILDTLPEQAYDDISRLASFICGTPISLVTMVDEDRQWFKSAQGWDETRETPREVSFCAHAILDPGNLMIVPDATRDSRFASNPLVVGNQNVRFYAGAPLVTESGEVLGTLCVIDRTPREISDEQKEALQALSRQLMILLESRRTTREMHGVLVEREQLAISTRAFAEEIADLYNYAPCGYHSLDENGAFIRMNETELRWLGYAASELIDKLSIFDVIPPECRAQWAQTFEQVKTRGRISEAETEFVRKDGTRFPVIINATAIYDKEGRFLATRSSVFNIMRRKQAEQLLQRSEARFHAFMDNGPMLAFMKDAGGCFIYVNHALLERFEKRPEEILGKCDSDLWAPEIAGPIRENDIKILNQDKVVTFEEMVPTPDGIARHWLSFKFPLPQPDGSKVLAGMSIDITERKFYEGQMESYQKQLENMVARLEELASTDALTGLKNKGAFDTRLGEEWQRARRYGLPLSLVVLDVDYFKQYNDSFGHPAGDEILKQFANILRYQARPSDFVARTGGEEFSVILTNTDADGAFIVAERLRRAIETATWPHRAITASFGVAAITPQTPDPSALIQRADRALYDAKQKGRDRVSRAGE